MEGIFHDEVFFYYLENYNTVKFKDNFEGTQKYTGCKAVTEAMEKVGSVGLFF